MEDLFKLMITQRKQVHLTTKPSSLDWQQSHAIEARMCPKTVKKKYGGTRPTSCPASSGPQCSRGHAHTEE